MLMLGCAPVEPSWALLDPVAEPEVVAPAVAPPTGEDPRFKKYEDDVAAGEEPWGKFERDSRGNLVKIQSDGDAPADGEAPDGEAADADAADGEASDSEAADAEVPDGEAADGEAADAEDGEAADKGDADPVGVAVQAAWGVRLVQTFESRQPPKAALGMPDGQELIVAPGSMLPDVGMVVIAVGKDMVQLAHVVPEGDHAEIETTTLHAQYPSTAD